MVHKKYLLLYPILLWAEMGKKALGIFTEEI